jgi:hypothetical protein
VRIDRKASSGNGSLSTIQFTLMDTNAAYKPGGEWIYLRFAGAALFGSSGNALPYNAMDDSAMIFLKPPVRDTTTDTGSWVHRVTAKEQITIYPNPACNVLTIESENPGILSVNLVNVVGQTVLSQPFGNSRRSTIDVSSLADGFYIVIVKTAKGSVVQRVVIRK